MKTIHITLLLLLSLWTSVFAQDSNVTVVGSGEGSNETNAINQALRNCIEKSMGAFLSSNTIITNDSLVKDEIITIASGNIVSYDMLSVVNEKDSYKVTVSAIISPEKLINSLKSKGFAFELNGSVYAQNILKEEFYSKQEEPALNNFLLMWEKIPFYEFEIKITEPILYKGSSQAIFAKNAEFPKYYNESQAITFKSYAKHNIIVKEATLNQLRYDQLYSNHYFQLKSIPKNAETLYTIYVVFTPKITTNYLSFVNSFFKLLNSISIKNIDEYKLQHADYAAVAVPMRNISVKGFEASNFPNAKWDNNFQTLVFYLRNTNIKNVFDKFTSMIEFKSTGLNFHSEQVDDNIIKKQLVTGYEESSRTKYGFICQYCGDFTYTMRAKDANNYFIYPYFILPTSVLPLFYSVNELQNLKRMEFKSELAFQVSENQNKESNDSIKFERDEISQYLATLVDSINKKNNNNNEWVFTLESVDVEPQIGDTMKFVKYASTKRYPTEARKNKVAGRVLVSYITEKDGSVSNSKIYKGIGSGCDEEAIRFISSMPKRIPAHLDGKPVRVITIGAFDCKEN